MTIKYKKANLKQTDRSHSNSTQISGLASSQPQTAMYLDLESAGGNELDVSYDGRSAT